MTVIERPRDQRESRVPRHPSNRSLVEKMGEWGWRIVKQGSKRWVLEAPYGDGRVEVMPPALHEANPTSVFLDVYRLTSAGDPELFWRGPSRLAIDMLNEHLLAKKKEKQAREAAEREKQAAVAAERAAAAPAPPTSVSNLKPPGQLVVVPTAAPKAEPTPEPPTVVFVTRPYTKGRTSSVLDAVNASPRSMTIRQVASRIGLDVSDPGEHRRLIQSLSALAREGKITRPAKGVYRRLAKDVTPAAPAAPEVQPAPQEVAVLTPQPVEAPPAPADQAAAESVDDVIEAVLDLLLPNGFQAKHLRVIAPWIEATKRMVEAVAG